MKDFLLIYKGVDPSFREKRTAAELDAVMQAWGQWFKQLESTGNLRNPGAPLAPGGMVVRADGAIETDTAMAEVKELIGGYSVIAAESLEQAAELAKGTPFLRNHPNGSVIVQPILQLG